MGSEIGHYLKIIEQLKLPSNEKFRLQIELVYAYALQHYPEDVDQALRGLDGSTLIAQRIVMAVKAEYDDLGIADEDALSHVISKLEKRPIE